MLLLGTKGQQFSKSLRLWMVEAGPAALILAALFVKFVYASVTIWEATPRASSVVSAMLASVLILGAPLTWFGRTWRVVNAILLNFFLTVLLISDRIHYRFFGDILSVGRALTRMADRRGGLQYF